VNTGRYNVVAFSVCVPVHISDSARMTSLLLWRHKMSAYLQCHLYLGAYPWLTPVVMAVKFGICPTFEASYLPNGAR